MCTTSTSCSRRRWSASRLWADRGAVVNRATLLPVTGVAGRGRITVATTGTSFTACDRVTHVRRRAVLGVRQDDEVGDEDPVRIEVAGEQLEVGRRVGDEHAAARGDRWHGGAAALEDDEVGSTLDGKPSSGGDVRGRRPLRPGRRRRAGSRSCRRLRAPRPRGSRTPRGALRPPARGAGRATCRPRRPPARRDRPGPSRRRARSRSRA